MRDNLARVNTELFEFEDAPMVRPKPTLYLIQFRRNINNTFGNVVPINNRKGQWEPHGSYESEKDMLHAFDEVCKRPNVVNGLYTFRCVWPDGRTRESQALTHAFN